jgi:ribosome recycling factor
MFDEKSYSLKMDKTIEVFTKELSSLRTGSANAAMLDLVKVDVYGQLMPINQVASITTPEPRMINIQVWDQNNVSLIDAAINKSELGLNPQIDGQLIRLPVPELNEERRTELKKIIKSMGEKCKVSIRNIRREANEELKNLLKSKNIGEDEEKSFEKNVQNITDKHVSIVDEKVASKENENNDDMKPFKSCSHHNGW